MPSKKEVIDEIGSLESPAMRLATKILKGKPSPVQIADMVQLELDLAYKSGQVSGALFSLHAFADIFATDESENSLAYQDVLEKLVSETLAAAKEIAKNV